MRKFAPFVSSLTLAAMLIVNFTPPVQACGPFSLDPVFVFDNRADVARADYIAGKIGIIRPRYTRGNLVVAYRYFNRLPFAPAEQKAVLGFWGENAEDDSVTDEDLIKRWIELRKKIVGDEPPPQIQVDKQSDFYSYFRNCTTNALETAAKTLEMRIAEHGAADSAVADWLRAQETVFSNCGGGKNLPADAAANAPAWLKKDSAYQRAAAEFYIGNFAEARQRFEAIAADETSVWRGLSDYLVARTLIRQANFGSDPTLRKNSLEAAETRLEKIYRSQSKHRLDALAMLNLIRAELRPDEQLHDLAVALAQPNAERDVQQDLIDYTTLLDDREKEIHDVIEEAKQVEKNDAYDYFDYYELRGAMRYEELPANLRADDLTDWMLTFQLSDAGSAKRALDRWRETKAEHWLVAALSKSKASDENTSELINAAENVNRGSAAFPTVVYHQIRLLLESNRLDGARRRLAELPTDFLSALPISAHNSFLSLKMFAATDLNEFLRFAPRRAAAFVWSDSGKPYDFKRTGDEENSDGYLARLQNWQNRLMFDEDAIGVFERQMPLAVLLRVSANPQLPDYLRRQLTISVFARAVLLENDAAARQAASNLARLAPEMRGDVARYLGDKTAKSRRNSALFLLLKFPVFSPHFRTGVERPTPIGQIDNYRDNWWCAAGNKSVRGDEAQITAEVSALNFLSDSERETARRENEKLAALGGAPNYLTTRAIELGRAAPNDDRVPEMLHRAVKTTRYGCTDCKTFELSKTAYDLLHRRYPNNQWTGKTRFWFGEACENAGN